MYNDTIHNKISGKLDDVVWAEFSQDLPKRASTTQNLNDTIGKSTQKRCAFFEGNKVIFHFLRSLGMLPFSEEKDGSATFTLKSLPILYFVFINAILLAITGISIVAVIKLIVQEFKSNGNDDKILIFISTSPVAVFCLNICFFSDMKRFIAYMENWATFQVRYKTITGHSMCVIDNKKYQCAFVAVVTALAAGNGYYTSIHLMPEVFEKSGLEPGHASYYYLTILLILTVHSWCVILSAWGLWWYMLKTIRMTATQALIHFKECQNRVHDIKTYHRLWRELGELCIGMTEASSSAMLMYISIGFLGIMAGWFVTVTTQTGNVTHNFIISAACTRFVTLIPEYCHQTTEKVGHEFQKEIMSKRRRLSMQDEEHEKALDSFEKTIIEFPPEFTIAGCFTLNRRFNVSVFINCAQAMVILYQLNTSAETNIKNVATASIPSN